LFKEDVTLKKTKKSSEKWPWGNRGTMTIVISGATSCRKSDIAAVIAKALIDYGLKSATIVKAPDYEEARLKGVTSDDKAKIVLKL